MLNGQYIDRRLLDLPSTILTYKDKKVEYHYNLAPTTLIKLTKEIELLMNALNWQETLPSNKS
jgi:hypothetical protein